MWKLIFYFVYWILAAETIKGGNYSREETIRGNTVFQSNFLWISGIPGTPGSSHLQGPTSGSQMHHPDFHHPSPQHGHMGMAGMHSSPTKMHPAGGTQGHHGHQAGAPFHWSHGAEMPIPGAAGGSRGENMPLDSSGMYSTNRTALEYLTRKNLD